MFILYNLANVNLQLKKLSMCLWKYEYLLIHKYTHPNSYIEKGNNEKKKQW